MSGNDVIVIRFDEGALHPFVTPIDFAEIVDALETAFRVAGMPLGLEVEFSFAEPPRSGCLEFRLEAHYRSDNKGPLHQRKRVREKPVVSPQFTIISVGDAAAVAALAWMVLFGSRTMSDVIEWYEPPPETAERTLAQQHVADQERNIRTHVNTALKDVQERAREMSPTMVEISIPDVGKFVLYRPPSGLERVRFNADWSARNAPSQVLSIRRRPGEPFKIRYKGEELPAFYADSDAAGVVIAIWAKEGPLPPVAREYDEGEVTGEVLVRAPHADYRDLEEVDPLAEPLHPAGIYVVTKAAALE